ncbi:Ig-like domain-containing protein [Mesotoga prima]|uniref:Ig-like domain-containing protein n=1 Tax=Mesotoga prima TaxID=1184387 RepID=UPI002C4390B1|nr:Ig-like domain-containing protein [Mesotoga prima]HQN60331.1 Ig-like domain-containing protein [Mesotoga prima]
MRKWFFWALLMVVVVVVFAIRLLPDMLNKPPIISIPDMIIDEGSTLSIDLHDYSSDEKMTSLSYTKISGPGEVKENFYIFSPSFQQSGSHSVTISVVDPKEQMAESSFEITVREVNRPPELSIPDQVVAEGETISINLDEYANDPDLDALNYSLTEGNGQIIGSNYTYEPDFTSANYERVTISVSDGRGEKAVSTFMISNKAFATSATELTADSTSSVPSETAATGLDSPVTSSETEVADAQNLPPTADVPDQTLEQGNTLVLDLRGFVNDPEDEPLSINLKSGPGEVQRTLYSYVSPPGDAGSKTVVLEISDGKNVVEESFQVNIESANRAPLASSIPEGVVFQSEQYRLNLENYFNDPDGDSLSFQLLNGPGRIEGSTYTFQSNEPGRYSVTIRASDGKGEFIERTANLTVVRTNNPPTISILPRRIAEGDVLTIDLSEYASDPDNDLLSFSLVSGPGTIQGETYTFDADYGTAGTYEAVVSVGDGKGGSARATLRIDVRESNRPPELNIPGFTIAEGSRLVVDLSEYSSDPNNDNLSFEIVQGMGTIEGSRLIIEPGFEDYGFYTIVVTASDGRGGQTSSTFDLLITDTNRPPEFNVPDQTTIATRTLRLDLRQFSIDPDGDYLRYELVYGPGVLTGSIYSFIPEELGSNTVMLTANDLKGGEATATFTITVR